MHVLSTLVILYKCEFHCKVHDFKFMRIDLIMYFIFRMLPSVQVLAIHGKMKDKRYKVFNEFRRIKSGALICTDVMARGVDISEVDWVLQYDPPCSASSFVHR